MLKITTLEKELMKPTYIEEVVPEQMKLYLDVLIK